MDGHEKAILHLADEIERLQRKEHYLMTMLLICILLVIVDMIM